MFLNSFAEDASESVRMWKRSWICGTVKTPLSLCIRTFSQSLHLPTLIIIFKKKNASPDQTLSSGSLVGNDVSCQSSGCEFEPELGQHSFRRLTKVTATSVIRHLNRWTGSRDMTEQLLKTPLNPDNKVSWSDVYCVIPLFFRQQCNLELC